MERKYPLSKSEKEHGSMVRMMFSGIAKRYDLMNHLLSLFFDIHWRRSSIKLMDLKGETNFLDLACGTGDLAISVATIYPELRIFCLDFNRDMIEIAKRKAQRKKLDQRMEFVLGDVLSLPFKDSSFDAVGIAFGIRNIKNRNKALSEIKRVTKRGGKIMVLEMGLKGRNDGRMIRAYMRFIFPFLAKIASTDHMAYVYLKETIESFPSSVELSEEMRALGIKVLRLRTFWPGLTHMILGLKD